MHFFWDAGVSSSGDFIRSDDAASASLPPNGIVLHERPQTDFKLDEEELPEIVCSTIYLVNWKINNETNQLRERCAMRPICFTFPNEHKLLT